MICSTIHSVLFPMYYRLLNGAYVVRNDDKYVIHHVSYGDLCRIDEKAKEVVFRLAQEEGVLEKLSQEDKLMAQVLIEQNFLVSCRRPLSYKILDNPDELRKEYIVWFKDVTYLIVKVTNRCNLGCKYCHENANMDREDMTLDLFCNLVNKVLKSTKHNKISILLFGGEPTLMPLEWYMEALKHVREAEELFEKKVTILLQSNFIKVSAEKLRLFRDAGIKLSTSIDNPINPLSSYRPLANEVIKTCIAAQNMGFEVGVILTINKTNINDISSICHWMADNLGKIRFKANVMHPVGSGETTVALSSKEIFEAQKNILTYMIKTEGRELVERNLAEEIVRFFENHLQDKEPNKPAMGCCAKNCGAGKTLLSVEPNGDIYPCARLSDDIEYLLGNVNNYGLDSSNVNNFFNRANQFHNVNQEIWQKCQSCSAKTICSYGCKAFIIRSKTKENIECKPTLLRFAFYQENKDALRKVYETYVSQNRNKREGSF